MASEYVRLHIMKHALEHYIKREGASDKDIRQEKKVLDDVARWKCINAKKLDTR